MRFEPVFAVFPPGSGYVMAALFFVADVLAQPISLGVKGGIRATESIDADSSYHREDGSYTVGPVVEVKLPRNFAVEANPRDRRSYGFKVQKDISGNVVDVSELRTSTEEDSACLP